MRQTDHGAISAHGPGKKHLSPSTRLYGGTGTQFSQTNQTFRPGPAEFVDFDDIDAIKGRRLTTIHAHFARRSRTPGGLQLWTYGQLQTFADDAGVPLIIDNTNGDAIRCGRSIETWGRLSGPFYDQSSPQRTVTGGLHRVDSANLTGAANGQSFPSLSQPEPAYHGLNFARDVWRGWPLRFHGIHRVARLGMTMNPRLRITTLMAPGRCRCGWRAC